MLNEVPLSSLGTIPVTEETRARAIAEGLPEASLTRLTEMGAQALLRLRNPTAPPPSCHTTEYDPGAALCHGCLFAATCWPADTRYLLEVGQGATRPPSVPDATVAQRVEWARAQDAAAVVPDGATDTAALRALGYDMGQIARMLPRVRVHILRNEVRNEGVSISRGGELRTLGGPPMPPAPTPAGPPPPPPARRAPPPPPPPAPRKP